MKFRPEMHIIGKAYYFTKENMNLMIEAFEFYKDLSDKLAKENDALRKERNDLFIELGKYADVPSFEYWKDHAEKAWAKIEDIKDVLEKIRKGDGL